MNVVLLSNVKNLLKSSLGKVNRLIGWCVSFVDILLFLTLRCPLIKYLIESALRGVLFAPSIILSCPFIILFCNRICGSVDCDSSVMSCV